MDGDAGAIKKIEELNEASEPQIVTAISVFELYSGLERSVKNINELEKIKSAIENTILAGLDIESAQRAGEIDGQLIKSGEKIDPEDCLIAGIALTRNDKLLTRNIKHFSKIKGLKVETY